MRVYDQFFNILEDYILERIEQMHVKLENADINDVIKLQAKISAYRELLGLRNILDMEDNGK